MASYRDADDCEMESDSEVALDLKGRKHVDKSANADGVYWMQTDTASSYYTFPMPGKAAADALRSFLGGLLPLNAITDEYGHVTPIAHVANDHLPTLQARLWTGDLRGSNSSWPQVSATE